MMHQPSELARARRIYADTGKCSHDFTEPSRPYKCKMTLTNCMVCGKETDRKYDEGVN